jgi:hypothetical protein
MSGWRSWRSAAGVAIAVLALAALAWRGGAAADAPALEVAVDRGTIEVGDPLRLDVWVDAAPGTRVELPARERLPGDLDILSGHGTRIDTLPDGRLRHRRSWTVTAFRPGEAVLLPLTARLLEPFEGTVDTQLVRSDTLRIDVASLVEAAGADSVADIHGLKAPVELPVPPDWRRWALVAALLVGTAIAIAAWRRWRARRRPPVPRPMPIDRQPADLWALAELEGLRRADLPRSGAFKEHFTRLTDILRPYLERCFGIKAVERTSDEIAADLERLSEPRLGESERRALRGLLEEADLVKFARHRPPAAAAMGAIDQAAAFVRATAVRLPPAAAPPGAPGTGAPAGGAAADAVAVVDGAAGRSTPSGAPAAADSAGGAERPAAPVTGEEPR